MFSLSLICKYHVRSKCSIEEKKILSITTYNVCGPNNLVFTGIFELTTSKIVLLISKWTLSTLDSQSAHAIDRSPQPK